MPTPSILVLPRRVNNSWPAGLTKAEVSPSLFTPHQILYRASLNANDQFNVVASICHLWKITAYFYFIRIFSQFYAGSMLLAARSHTSSPDSPFSVRPRFKLAIHLCFDHSSYPHLFAFHIHTTLNYFTALSWKFLPRFPCPTDSFLPYFVQRPFWLFYSTGYPSIRVSIRCQRRSWM